jgi:endonuclease G
MKAKRKVAVPTFWLLLFVALGYYILNPGRINEIFMDSFADSTAVEKIVKVENLIKEVKIPKIQEEDFTFTSIPEVKLFQYLYPSHDGRKQIVTHTAYTLEYDEENEQADWVAYILDSSRINDEIKRKDHFRADSAVSTGSATPADYLLSGYDRGHLAPAADMKITKETMDESFYMSNMSPQTPALNRRIWKDLETQVRLWADLNKVLYIVTGPVLTGQETKKIGKDEVTVPEYFYKVILDYTEPEVKAVGFILPNGEEFKDLKDYAVTVNRVEEETGIDFFEKLPDEFENRIESIYIPEMWW